MQQCLRFSTIRSLATAVVVALTALHATAQDAPPAKNLSVTLQTLSADQLHARLEKAFGQKIAVARDPQGVWSRFSLSPDGGAAVVISANSQTKEVRIAGQPGQLKTWAKIIAALDAPSTPERQTQVLATEPKTQTKVRQVVNLLLAQNENQDVAGGPAGLADDALQAVLGPVQIEAIEGTNYLIIRGNPRDVERVREVIRQIEELSRVVEPAIVVYTLAHIDSAAIAALVDRAFDPADPRSLARVYGSILVVPLVKPNAVLMIGQPSTVNKASELLEALDQPGDALTEYRVFRLKHAQAQQAEEMITQLFAPDDEDEGPTLGPRALVIVDQRTNSLFVRAAPRDMAEVSAVISKLDTPSGDIENEVRIFRLRNSVATDLAPVLQQAVSGQAADRDGETAQKAAALLQLVTIDEDGRRRIAAGVLAGAEITADARANALVVAAPKDAMPLLAALINELDRAPEAVAELKVFTIENGDAVTLAEMLRELFGEPGSQGGDQGGSEGQELYELRLSVDERTNSIIAAGSAEEMIAVEAILRTLDTSDARERENRVYRLKNASAEDVAFSLQDWLQGRREVDETAAGLSTPFQQFEREVVVVPEINSNSLIISASPQYFDELTRIIEKLDEQAPMVMIQVLIGEVRLGDADEFGVELGLQDSLLFDRSLLEEIETTTNTTITNDVGGGSTQFEQQIIQSAELTPGFNFGDSLQPLGNSGSDASLATAGAVAAQGLASFAMGRTSENLGFGGLVLSASSDSISMLLRALQESRRLEVLSRPQIMTLDNQRGRAFVGEQVPFITDVRIDQFGQPQPSVDFRDVGLVLDVLPRISPDGLVVMEVDAAKRELAPISEGVPIFVAPGGEPIRVPRIIATEATTTVSAVSGQTVVLSGLLTKRDEALHRRVPILADVPLLGDLFRFDATRTLRTELLIILTPHIVRNRHEAEMIKQTESARMSWCLSDVVDMHGLAGLRSRNDALGAAEAETVYPEAIRAPDPVAPLPQMNEIPGPAPTFPSSPEPSADATIQAPLPPLP